MQSTSQFNPLWLLPIFPAFFIILWCSISFLISRLSGWSTLSNRFSSALPFSGQTWNWQSARMRLGTNYGSSLIVGADPSGIFLATIFLFRIGHAPLLLPWHEVSIRRDWQVLNFRYLELTLGREEQIPFRVNGRLADRLRTAAGTVGRSSPQACKQNNVSDKLLPPCTSVSSVVSALFRLRQKNAPAFARAFRNNNPD